MIDEIATEVIVEGATELAGQLGFEAAVEVGTEALAGDKPANSWKRFCIRLFVIVAVCAGMILGTAFFMGQWP